MSSWTKAILILLLCSSYSVISAQYDDGLFAKKLFIDYDTPDEWDIVDFRQWQSGFEFGYLRRLDDKLTVVVPVKVAVVSQLDSLTNDVLIGLEGQLRYSLVTDKMWTPYIAAGAGVYTENLNDAHAVIPAMFGADLNLSKKTQINFEAGYRFGLEDNRDNVQLAVGFTHIFGPREAPKPDTAMTKKMPMDSDGDGIVDEIDVCPQTPGLDKFLGCPDTDEDGIQDFDDDCPKEPGPKELNGCPDTDGDGISDKEDECPTRPGPKENNGCPAPDSDGDGIINPLDDCPLVPGIALFNGCPDTDGDGIKDSEDMCPEQPGTIANNGCPDTDGDGVIDKDDRCPTVAGSVDNLGCPEIKAEEREILEFAVQNVEFDLGKATLKPSSFSILDQIAEIAKRYPNYTLRISGHTDNTGGDELNQRLSEQRARSCYEYLSSKGVSTSRMNYVGYGETRPLKSNATAEGRSHNRRVEFDLYIE